VCKLIAELSGTNLTLVKETVKRLEARSGLPGVDIRLTGDVYVKANQKLKELGFDPKDTTSSELYEALLNITRLHDNFLRDKFNIPENADNDAVLAKVVFVVNKMNIIKSTWVLKPSSIKRLLSALPPKTLQKLLGYRSMDSMLKREPAKVLLAMAKYSEPLTWQQKLKTQYRHLSAMDFEPRDIEINYLGDEKLRKATAQLGAKAGGNFITSPETGSVLILPAGGSRRPGLALLATVVIIEALLEIRMCQTYLKFHQMTAGFGNLLVDVLFGGKGYHIEIAGQKASWKVIHRYYGQTNSANHPSIFQPHIQPEDLAFHKAELTLTRLEPALYFWYQLDYVGLPKSGGPISFNLMDNLINLVNNLPFEDRLNTHMQQAIWDELYARYLGQEGIEQELLEMLDERVTQQTSQMPDMEFVL
jgi:hypothetical protein